jgi:uncharacterized protein YgiM (DUF1202 family)
MIEIFGKDGRAFRFQDGTSDDVIQATMDKHYQTLQEAAVSVGGEASVPPPQLEAQAPPNPQISIPPPIEPVAPQAAYQSAYYDDRTPAPAENAMKFALMAGAVALGVLTVTGILWMTGMIGQRAAPPTSGSTPTSASSAYQATPQPDMRQALVATQIRQDSKSNSNVLKELTAGATVDVLGEQTIAGTTWVRVRLDQTTSDVGYIIASHLGAMGTAAPAVSVVPTSAGGVGSQVLAVPPPGRTQVDGSQATMVPVPAQTRGAAMPTTTYYVVSRQLNVRATASPDAARTARLNFGTPVLADAQSNYQGRIWLRVRANNGVSGWINSDLVALTPASAPVDEVAYSPPPPGRYVAQGQNYPSQVSRVYVQGDAVVVTALNANVRAEPSARGGTDTVIDVAPNGDAFNIERIARSGGKIWYRITTGKGITGWISSDTVQVE